MTKLTLSRIASTLFLSAAFACATIAKSPIVTVKDASVSDVYSEAGDDSQEAGEASATDASAEAAVIVEDAGAQVDTKLAFVEYIFNAMKEWVPPISQCYWDPDKAKYQKCIDDVETHHSEVAQTIVDVVLEPNIVLPITGNNNKVKSALLMASIAKDESHYSQKVDTCVTTGDHGASVGLWQTLVLDRNIRKSICSDRSFALRYAIKIVNMSFESCKNRPIQDKLITYACGFCTEPPASEQRRHAAWVFSLQDSRRKVNRAINYLAAHPYTDQ